VGNFVKVLKYIHEIPIDGSEFGLVCPCFVTS
jgi:hypothetical protein